MIEIDDSELMARAGEGDRKAWQLLYERHREFVFRVACRFLGSEADARDVVQEVFVAVLTRARHYRPAGKLTTYLWRVVANRCLNERARLRHRHEENQEASGGRRLEESHAQGGLESLAESEERSPERLLERKRSAARVRAAILSLPERQRLAVVLSRFEGMSYEEISQALSCSVSSVESLLFRARQNLLRRLEPP